MAMSVKSRNVTFKGELAEKIRRLATLRHQDVTTLVETLVDQAESSEMQSAIALPEKIKKRASATIPRPGSMTAKLSGALGPGTQEEISEIFAYDYDYELSKQ